MKKRVDGNLVHGVLADSESAVAGRIAIALALHRTVAFGTVLSLSGTAACCIRHAEILARLDFKALVQGLG